MMIFGAVATPRAMSLKPFNAVILATVFAFTLTASPVAGLRAMRAGRYFFANFAKPEMFTTSPLATVARITSIVPSTTAVAVFLSTSAWIATAWMRSRFFISLKGIRWSMQFGGLPEKAYFALNRAVYWFRPEGLPKLVGGQKHRLIHQYVSRLLQIGAKQK